MNHPLKGMSIVVTGAFGVLGKAISLAAAEAGATVAAVDRAPASSVDFGVPHVKPWGETDLMNADSAARTFSEIAQSTGGIQGLVNVAGGFKWETVASGSMETWDFMYNINIRTTVSATKAALPHLLKGSAGQYGRIVNIGAASASRATRGMGAYTAAKSGVSRLTEALASELLDQNITVNAILPSIIDTPTNRKDMPDSPFDRWVSPQQAAAVVLFLLSESSQAVTGASIAVNGRVAL